MGCIFCLRAPWIDLVFFFWFLEFESLNPKYAVFFCGMNGPTIRKTLAPPLLFGATHFVWGCVEGPGCVKEFSTLNETNARCYLVCFLRKGISYGSSSQTWHVCLLFLHQFTMERNLRGLLKIPGGTTLSISLAKNCCGQVGFCLFWISKMIGHRPETPKWMVFLW